MSTRAPQVPVQGKQHASCVPFYQLPPSLPADLSIEQFVKDWIQQIFFSNRKIQTQARFRIAEAVNRFKLFELSSCSSVYELMRSKIEEISQSLRSFMELSFGVLDKQKLKLTRVVQQAAGCPQKPCNGRKGTQPDQASLGTVYPPIGKMLVLFYKYVCVAIKETCNFWKSIYSSIQVKDLEISTFQKSISTFVLEIFTTPTKLVTPLTLLPSMSLVNKCKFICADSQGVARRLQLTKFDEDEMRKVLMQKKARKKQPFGINPEDLSDLERQMLEEIKGHFARRSKAENEYKKHRIDIPFIEELKNQIMMEDELQAEPGLCPEGELYQLGQDWSPNLQLSTTFERHSGLAYQVDDSQSQDDLAFYDDDECDRDELVLESQDILLEYLQAKVHRQIKEIDGSTKLSASTANEERNQICQGKGFDFLGSNEFYLPSEGNAEELSAGRKARVEGREQKNLDKLITEKMCEAKMNELQLKENTLNLKKNQKMLQSQNSKKYIQEEKERLQKYKQELQREKKELLKEVERFMKEKEKDERYFKQVSTRFRHQTLHRHLTCECTHLPKKTVFGAFKGYQQPEDYRPQCAHNKDMHICQQHSQHQKQKQRSVERAIANQIYKDLDKYDDQAGEVHNPNQQNSSSKKRQKNRKKAEKQLKSSVKQEKSVVNEKAQEPISEDQVQLTKFMETFKINDSSRTHCNVDEGRLQRWKERISRIRTNELSFKKAFAVERAEKEQKKQEKGKKKHKR